MFHSINSIGLPLCHLPSDILETEVYQRFFGDMAFEVQPDNKRRFSTTKKYSGCVYEFKKMSGEIIIIERDDKGFERELIHYVKLNGDFLFQYYFQFFSVLLVNVQFFFHSTSFPKGIFRIYSSQTIAIGGISRKIA